MPTTQFLGNATLWEEIQRRVTEGTNVRAAVAYFASGGAEYLPLRKGHTLVVDMSPGTVKAGATDPREIEKLIRRGVSVFSRPSLHAKFLVIDDTVLAGSANVSLASRTSLDEAGLVTNDPVAVRRAVDLFEKLCSEPVRREYLKVCVDLYRPPKSRRGNADTAGRKKGNRRAVLAKLWFVGGLHYAALPEAETAKAEAIEKQAAAKLKDPGRTELDFIHFPKRVAFLEQIQVSDWVIQCVVDSDRNRYVHAPEQVVAQESYARGKGKRRHLLLLEKPRAAESMTLSQFRRRIRRIMPELDRNSPRTRPVVNVTRADVLLRLWTPHGRIAKRLP